MKVLYFGPTWHGSNAQSFRRAFERLGHDVAVVDLETPIQDPYRSVPMKIVRRLAGGPLERHRKMIRGAAVRAAKESRPELVFFCKTIHLDGQTLADIKKASGAFLIHWHPDDYRNPANQTPAFLGALPLFDVCVTPKSFNVAELEADGARRVEFLPYAFDPEVHHPVPPRPGPPRAACFVGAWEAERAAYLQAAAERGVDLEVWGGRWERAGRGSALRRVCTFQSVFADDMARVFASSNLSLGFLRKVNRDRHTARTFEIPASGGLLLAERTDEQRSFFEEGREALYFDTAEEMIATIQEYANRPTDVARMRKAAVERCWRDGYSYEARLKGLLTKLALV